MGIKKKLLDNRHLAKLGTDGFYPKGISDGQPRLVRD